MSAAIPYMMAQSYAMSANVIQTVKIFDMSVIMMICVSVRSALEMARCPCCLNGFRRDVVVGIDEDGHEITSDIECNMCDGLGIVSDEAYRRWQLECHM